jgi:hypothetical protein
MIPFRQCPCGAELATEADKAHGVCHYCRVDAKKSVRNSLNPDFEDAPMPGFEDYGAAPSPGRWV